MVQYTNPSKFKARDLPRTDRGLRRGQTAYTARHSRDQEEKAKAREALKRARAKRLDTSGKRDDDDDD